MQSDDLGLRNKAIDQLTAEDRLRLHVHDEQAFAFTIDDAESLVPEIDALRAELAAKDAAIDRLVAENRALTEALTPSGATKAEYIGEFTIAVERTLNEDEEADDSGNVDPYDHIQVPWTTIKQIMAAISARARQALGDT